MLQIIFLYQIPATTKAVTGTMNNTIRFESPTCHALQNLSYQVTTLSCLSVYPLPILHPLRFLQSVQYSSCPYAPIQATFLAHLASTSCGQSRDWEGSYAGIRQKMDTLFHSNRKNYLPDVLRQI